jgi:hypothetical protein
MSGDGSGIEGRPQDDYVTRVRPAPTDDPPKGLVLRGFLGDSDRAGYRRLYLTRDLARYFEFMAVDVIAVTDVPPAASPSGNDAATEVRLRDGARVEITRSATSEELEFGYEPLDAASAGLLRGHDSDDDACYCRHIWSRPSYLCGVFQKPVLRARGADARRRSAGGARAWPPAARLGPANRRPRTAPATRRRPRPR